MAISDFIPVTPFWAWIRFTVSSTSVAITKTSNRMSSRKMKPFSVLLWWCEVIFSDHNMKTKSFNCGHLILRIDVTETLAFEKHSATNLIKKCSYCAGSESGGRTEWSICQMKEFDVNWWEQTSFEWMMNEIIERRLLSNQSITRSSQKGGQFEEINRENIKKHFDTNECLK